MDVITVAKMMNHKITELGELINILGELAQHKANALMNYEKALAITLVKLRNGDEVELDGKSVENLPITLMEKVAKGICSKERYNLEVVESAYKSAITKISAIEAQLSGYQSMNRYIKEDIGG